MLHLPTSSVEVLFKFIIRPLTLSSQSRVSSHSRPVKSSWLESPARTSPSVWWSLLIGHSRTCFLWVWVYLQLFLTFSCKRTTTRCVCWQQHTRSNGDFCRLANCNNRLWHFCVIIGHVDDCSSCRSQPVFTSRSHAGPPRFSPSVPASPHRPLSLRSYCVLAEALQRLAASFISDLFNRSKSPFSLMSEVVWPEVVFLNRAPAAAGRSWSLMCRDARLKQALRTLHVGGEKKVH